MKLNDFVKNFPDLRIAGDNDNEKVLEFFESIPIQKKTHNVSIQRSPDFFALLKYQASKYFVFINENKEGRIEGMWAISFRPSYFNDKIEYVGYLADYRFTSKKHRISEFDWRIVFSEICRLGKDISDVGRCQYYYALIEDNNKFGMTRISNTKGVPYTNQPLCKFNMVSILGRTTSKFVGLHLPPGKDIGVSISNCSENEKSDLESFLDRQNRKRIFGYIFKGKENELERRLKTWDNFSLSSFFIARDKSGEIVGCCAPWTPSTVKQVIHDKFPLYVRALGKILKPLGKNVPDVGSEFKNLVLSHLELSDALNTKQKQRVLHKLLDAIYESGITKKYHVMTFHDYSNESLLSGFLLNYLYESTPVTAYQFFNSDIPNPVPGEFLANPSGFEIAMI